MRRYRNASEVLPEALLREVQRYAAGQTLYFPSDAERQQWGARSGARAFYEQRNAEIREQHRQHASLEHIAQTFGLSVETVRKIIFK